MLSRHERRKPHRSQVVFRTQDPATDDVSGAKAVSPFRVAVGGAAVWACALVSGCGESIGHQPPPTEVQRGKLLMSQYHCGSCHAIPDVPAARGTVAVSLESFGRRSYIAGRWPNDDEHLVRWLMNPQAMVPGTLMPTLGVSADEAKAMAAYLRSLR
jgi:cytochrome c